MPTTYAIIQGNQYMDATTYSGTGAAANVTNAAGFYPDLTWVKNRSSGVYWNVLFDSVRGAGNQLSSNQTDAELASASNVAGKVSAFNSNGFGVAAGSSSILSVNGTSNNYVGWQWAAGQGTTSNNTSGTITSTVSVNASAGFSIVTWTGNGTLTGQTVGHGLGVTPGMFITKARSETNTWNTWHKSLSNPALSRLNLNVTNAADTSVAAWGNTAPTSSIFGVGWESGSVFTNKLNTTYVAYCWSEVPGFSAFGSYTGNGNADGPFIYTGFRPKYVMIKNASVTASWQVKDTSRSPFNAVTATLYPNLSNAEASDTAIDILSNGFKLRGSSGGENGSGNTIIYAAWAETPTKFANAR